MDSAPVCQAGPPAKADLAPVLADPAALQAWADPAALQALADPAALQAAQAVVLADPAALLDLVGLVVHLDLAVPGVHLDLADPEELLAWADPDDPALAEKALGAAPADWLPMYPSKCSNPMSSSPSKSNGCRC